MLITAVKIIQLISHFARTYRDTKQEHTPLFQPPSTMILFKVSEQGIKHAYSAGIQDFISKNTLIDYSSKGIKPFIIAFKSLLRIY